MDDPIPKEEYNKKEVEILNRAFQAFNDATQQLQSSYDNLEERIKELDLELARKNEELSFNLKEKEEVKNHLHNILESLTTGVVVVNANGDVTTFNTTAGTIFSVAPQKCLGQPLKQAPAGELLENIVALSGQNPDGALTLDKELEIGLRGKLALRISASAVKDPNNQPQGGTVLIIQDITQLRRLEEEAQRNQRLRATGEMAAGIAHEIRNPLASIELFASLLQKDLAEDTEKRKLAERISSGVKNMDRIISSVLLFAKSAKPSRNKCSIDHLLKDLLTDHSDFIVPDNVKITQEYDLGDALANGDSALLKQVFRNLVQNAIQAMPEGGELSLSAIVDVPKSSNDIPGRKFIKVCVADNGPGIPKDKHDQIFNPFFTTKDKGAGLGLSISHNIIKAHQGSVDFETEEGKGTQFTVTLPCWDPYLDEE